MVTLLCETKPIAVECADGVKGEPGRSGTACVPIRRVGAPTGPQWGRGGSIGPNVVEVDDYRQCGGHRLLLIGWATNSEAILALGFIALVASLGVRIAAQLGGRKGPR
jgi:hypothetical protein